MNVLCAGVMGYSAQKFDKERAEEMLEKAFDWLQRQHPGAEIQIVSGYTDIGIPALAYRAATARGWKTVRVACEKAEKYDCYPCDEVHLVGEQWGDESPTFLNMCDVFVRVGGGAQSHREAEAAKAAGKQVIEYELEALE